MIDIAALIPVERRQQIIDQRITMWAEDLYGHQLTADAVIADVNGINAARLEADPKAELIVADTSTSDAAIESLTRAIGNAQSKKGELGAEVQAVTAKAEAMLTAELDAPLDVPLRR